MQPYELVRKAAEIIRAQGWAHGTNEFNGPVNARDAAGNYVALHDVGRAGDSRSKVNPAAWSFSIYGAIVKAMAVYREPVQIGLMWSMLQNMAEQSLEQAFGGTNYVHPLIAFNEVETRTVEEVLVFMETVAMALEAVLNPAVSQ